MNKITTITKWHFIALIITTLITAAIFYANYNNKVIAYKNSQYNDLQLQLKSVLFSYDTLTNHIYKHDINKPKITEIIYKASQTKNIKTREKLREKLYQILLPLYQDLQLVHIRQLHFHLPDAISFLRFHRRSKYGDSLVDIRPSLLMVNRNHKKVSGFEIGRVGNGFRNIFPLFYKSKFVGTAEISFSFSALKAAGMKLYPASYRLMVDKNMIKTKLWKDENENYELSDISHNYLYDKKTLSSENMLSNRAISRLHTKLPKNMNAILDKKTFFSDFITYEKKSYLVSFMPLPNTKGISTGYFIIYKQDNAKIHMRNTLYLQYFSLAIFVVIIIILLLLYRHYTKVVIFAKQQQELSEIDALTQISNRGFFQKMAPQLIEDAKSNKYELSVIFFDIDHFKNINDTYGHNAGDSVLQELTKLVKQQVREEDCFSRWGGEEFILVLPHVSQENAVDIAQKIRNAINSYKFSGIAKLTCSFGLTELKDSDTISSLIERADTALYQAKNEGRDCIRVKS